MNLKSKFFILTILMLLIPMIVIISNFYNYREDYYNKKEKENHADRGGRSRKNIDPGDSEQSISGSENLLCDWW